MQDQNTDAKGIPLIWHPAEKADAVGIWELIRQTVAYDRTSGGMSLDDVRRRFDQSDTNAQADSRLLLDALGNIVALGWVDAWRGADDVLYASLQGDVHPAYRRHGVGTALLDWMELRAQQRFAQMGTAHARRLRVRCDTQQCDRLTFFIANGYHPVRYLYDMQRDLSLPVPDKLLPPEINLVAWSKERDEETRAVWHACFRDAWDAAPLPPQTWRQFFMDNPDFHTGSSYLALASDHVVGLCLSWVRPIADRLVVGNFGYIAYLGVLSEWRGRGIATALLCATLQAYRAMNLTHARLGADSASPTRAQELYRSLGFDVINESIVLERDADI